MSDLTAASVPTALLTPTPSASASAPATGVSEAAKRAQIHQTAQKFEASFLSVMLSQMFDDKDADEGADPAFTGGSGAKMFQSFLAESIANKMVAKGGIGLAASVQREMLKMQGLH
ncbi:MAG TPA: rod-binding protein [Phenylobacterium sp.]|jgi:Rod binding domain-containing protein|uniref:rod-binding protein n=1 Tax=Phenylobacterium sp. TaxID=1871053 RepID=UPI002D268A7C|nr:rod-binding protein [Phenylobacterium sp.]HZZ67324.1 rod-binding protein [Phenylobacterium sp.]